MGVRVRRFKDEDRPGFAHVRSIVYRGGEPVRPEDRLLRDDCSAYVSEHDEGIIAATTVLHLTTQKHGRFLPCAGLAAVGVLPEHRRTGIGAAMMSQILPMLKEDGFVLASLYPFRASYYRRFGYEHCGHRLQITCPAERLPKVKSSLPVSKVSYENRSEIYHCYSRFSERYAGMNRREEDQWWRILGGDTPLEIYAVGQPIEGYAIVRLQNDFWEKQPVKELVWTTPRSYEGLLAFMRSLSINKTAVEWREPGNSPYMEAYFDQGAEIKLDHQIMFRIVDVPVALGAIKSTREGEFSFRVVDPDVPANAGPWQVCYSASGTRVTRTESTDFEIEIGPLTQAFLGEPSLRALHHSGLLKCDPGDQALEFFDRDSVYCTDFF